jgi:prevent-host-death family protein
MSKIGIKELQEQAEDLVTRVEETGEPIEIVVHGRVAVRLVPSRPVDAVEPLSDDERAQTELALARLKELGAEISKHWPEGISAVDAIRDVRRER